MFTPFTIMHGSFQSLFIENLTLSLTNDTTAKIQNFNRITKSGPGGITKQKLRIIV